jgi:hypothetical protein
MSAGAAPGLLQGCSTLGVEQFHSSSEPEKAHRCGISITKALVRQPKPSPVTKIESGPNAANSGG